MKILQLCNKPPVPAIDGGTIAMNNLTKGLSSTGALVHVMAITTPKHPEVEELISEEYRENHQPIFCFEDTLPTFAGAVSSLFSTQSYHLTRFFSEKFEEQLLEKIEKWQPDVILFESLFMSMYLHSVKSATSALLVYRAHNIEHVLWQKRLNEEKNLFKRWLLRPLNARLRKAEKTFVQEVDAVVPISKIDEIAIQKWHPRNDLLMKTVPFGYDFSELNRKTVPTDREKTLIYIGALDWQPNIEGLLWFLKKCWPQIYTDFPDWRFKIAGRNAYPEVQDIQQEGVEYLGEIEDAFDYYHQGGILVVPLFSGSGMRVKIIEAMASEIPIIATSQGVEGIACTPEKHFELAENESQFYQAAKTLIENPTYRKQLASKALDLVHQNYDCHYQAEDLVRFFKDLKA